MSRQLTGKFHKLRQSLWVFFFLPVEILIPQMNWNRSSLLFYFYRSQDHPPLLSQPRGTGHLFVTGKNPVLTEKYAQMTGFSRHLTGKFHVQSLWVLILIKPRNGIWRKYAVVDSVSINHQRWISSRRNELSTLVRQEKMRPRRMEKKMILHRKVGDACIMYVYIFFIA